MAAADGSIIIDVRADTSRATSALSKLAKLAATAFAVDKIIDFSKQAIQLGSDVAEVQNVVDVAFGDMSSAVDEFAQSAITNFGMSELAAKRTASTYMAMASNMGVTQQQAAEMAITLAGLTGDVASFYNISQELADIKLRSVFTGETETLKDLGIVMTQANLEAYALANGINRSFQSMSQSEQLILRYNYVLDQLSLASGDFVRTQDSWANQTRILSMQWQEFMSIIGQALIQVLLPVVRILNQIVSALIDIANAFNTAISAIFGGATTQVQQTQTAVGGVSAGIDEAVDNQNALTDATKETNKEQQKSLAAFDEINTLASGASGGSGSGGSAGGGMGLSQFEPITSENIVESDAESKILDLIERLKDAFAPFEESFNQAFLDISDGAGRLLSVFQNVWNDIRSLGSPIYNWFTNEFVDFLNQFIATIGNVIGGLLDSIAMVLSDLWNIVLFPALQQFITSILPALTEFGTQMLMTFNTLFNEVKTIFDMIWQDAIAPALSIVADIWMDLWDGIVQVWNEYGEPIFELIREAITNFSETLQNAWETIIKPVWDTLMSTLDELWNEHFKPLWDNILEFVAMLIEAALQIYNKFISPLVNAFIDTFGPAISGVLSGIVETVGYVLGVFADVANEIINALKGVVDFVAGVFTGDWERAWDGVKQIFSGVWNGIITALEGAVNLIIRGINWLISQLNKVHFTLPDWIPGVGGSSFGFNIPKISELSIPRLAQGSVVPPNREFLAVLGDNTKETEVVSPVSTMKQAFIEAMQEMGNVGGTQQINLVVDGRTLAKVIVPQINRMTDQAGRPVLKF